MVSPPASPPEQQGDDPSSVFAVSDIPEHDPTLDSHVPDPFQLDDPDDPDSDGDDTNENNTPFGAASQVTIVPAETDVPLQAEFDVPPHESTTFTPSQAEAMQAKPQPALPTEEVESIEQLTPQLYLPGLVVPGLFQPIHAVSVL